MNISISDLIIFYTTGVIAVVIIISYDYTFKKSKRDGLEKELNEPTPFEQSYLTKKILLLIALICCCLMSWFFIGDRIIEHISGEEKK